MLKTIFAFMILAPLMGFAQSELIEKTVSGESKAKNPTQARREIIDEATQQVTEEMSREFMGEEKFQKNKSSVLSKMNKQSARFVPFSKPGPIQGDKDSGYKMTVTLKVNPAIVKQILQGMGMLDENQAIPVVLPLVTFQDSTNGRTQKWWLLSDNDPDLAFVKTLNKQFETQLRTSMRNVNFHLLKPHSEHMNPSVPAGLRTEKLNPEYLKLFSDWFNAPLVMEGGVELHASPADSSRTRIDVKLTVLQASNGQVVADVVRFYDTDRGALESVVNKKWREVLESLTADLSNQVFEAWQKGSLGSSQIKMVIQPRPPINEIEGLKEALRSSSAGVRSIYERLVTADSLTFELTSQLSAAEIANRLKKTPLKGHTLEAAVGGDGVINAKWTKNEGAKQ